MRAALKNVNSLEELYYPRLNEEKPPGGANRFVVDRPVITFPLF